PRSANCAADQRFDGAPLRGISARVDQHETFAATFMNGAGPVDVHRKVQAIESSWAVHSLLDVPRPSAFAFPGRRRRVKVAGTTPIAVAGDEDLSVQVPAFSHLQSSSPGQ